MAPSELINATAISVGMLSKNKTIFFIDINPSLEQLYQERLPTLLESEVSR